MQISLFGELIEQKRFGVRRPGAADPEGEARRKRDYNKNRAHPTTFISDKLRKLKIRERLLGRQKPAQCESCNRVGRIVFDHDHKTGRGRGWLCDYCNRAAGWLGDDPERLRALADYLDKHG